MTVREMIRSRTKAEPEPAPNGPPIWSHPGRKAALQRSIALCDEMVELFQQQTGSDAEHAVGRFKTRRRELEQEHARTVEASVPDWAKELVDRKLTDRDRMIDHNAATARAAVRQFLAHQHPKNALTAPDIRQAGGYALQLLEIPLKADTEVFR